MSEQSHPADNDFDEEQEAEVLEALSAGETVRQPLESATKPDEPEGEE